MHVDISLEEIQFVPQFTIIGTIRPYTKSYLIPIYTYIIWKPTIFPHCVSTRKTKNQGSNYS